MYQRSCCKTSRGWNHWFYFHFFLQKTTLKYFKISALYAIFVSLLPNLLWMWTLKKKIKISSLLFIMTWNHLHMDSAHNSITVTPVKPYSSSTSLLVSAKTAIATQTNPALLKEHLSVAHLDNAQKCARNESRLLPQELLPFIP